MTVTAPVILLIAQGTFRGQQKVTWAKLADQKTQSSCAVGKKSSGCEQLQEGHPPPVYGFCSGGAADRLCYAVVLCCIFCLNFLQSSGLVFSHWLSCGEWWCYSVILKMPLWFVLPYSWWLERFARIAFWVNASIVNLELVTLTVWAFGSWQVATCPFCRWCRVVGFGLVLFPPPPPPFPPPRKFIWPDFFLYCFWSCSFLFFMMKTMHFSLTEFSWTSFPPNMAVSQ